MVAACYSLGEKLIILFLLFMSVLWERGRNEKVAHYQMKSPRSYNVPITLYRSSDRLNIGMSVYNVVQFSLNHEVTRGLYFLSSTLLNFLPVHMDTIGRTKVRKSRLVDGSTLTLPLYALGIGDIA